MGIKQKIEYIVHSFAGRDPKDTAVAKFDTKAEAMGAASSFQGKSRIDQNTVVGEDPATDYSEPPVADTSDHNALQDMINYGTEGFDDWH